MKNAIVLIALVLSMLTLATEAQAQRGRRGGGGCGPAGCGPSGMSYGYGYSQPYYYTSYNGNGYQQQRQAPQGFCPPGSTPYWCPYNQMWLCIVPPSAPPMPTGQHGYWKWVRLGPGETAPK